MKVLVYIETKEGSPVQGSLELLTAAKELGETLAVAVEDKDAAEKAADYKKLQTILAEEAASAFIQVPANTTAFNKNLAGYKFYPIYVQDMSTVYFVK